jgi:hypothetical protein
MGEQHSQKQGLRSSAQKEDRARDAYAELPASSQAAGAFGKNRRATPTDEELSLSKSTKRLTSTSRSGRRKKGKSN